MDSKPEKLYQAYLMIGTTHRVLFHSKASISVFTSEEIDQLARVWDTHKIGYLIEEVLKDNGVT